MVHYQLDPAPPPPDLPPLLRGVGVERLLLRDLLAVLVFVLPELELEPKLVHDGDEGGVDEGLLEGVVFLVET